ncbi:hypothetical protein WEN_01620 [Mycoplasma wenyonii str. Massachusetts]|uniref:Uncharacterized protein n=1 Tax=Mycoplasma wenyonii (strain Massachusetts) TaxID=1197325 RepID=I6ZEU0_MYCWM|nr:hypothetical protein [Mycoplasma wenyonii]AFN65117.1 hypothetical protein WEN_01620 [Mycoplasma wenyonii str. Massachusetts]
MYDRDFAGLSPFELIIFQSGTSKLTEAGSGMDSYKYGGDLYCEGNVFKVETYNQNFGEDKQWSKGFEKINLTLGQCDSKNGRQECSIVFGGDVGLKWKEEFKPRVII